MTITAVYEQIQNMIDPHYARLLAEHLEERRDTSARLSADAVRLAARAIRVYLDLLAQPKPQDDLDQAFVVEVIDAHRGESSVRGSMPAEAGQERGSEARGSGDLAGGAWH